MNKKKGVLSLILTAALIILLAYTCIVGFGPTGTGAAKNIMVSSFCNGTIFRTQ